ncbi:aminopeptidase [Zhaonella formicivorans]|uniref:aminopeptidase n=1 Tax=Zhaonella formicivorans TaxID=2528593 RepID=UPI0010D31361|nr:aminopeptidase [Zhaonella formicivorans]
MTDLATAARVVLGDCMGVKAGEKVLVVVDTPLRNIGQVLLQAAVEKEAEAVYMEMLPRESNGQEPPRQVAAAMLEADVVLMATSKSLSHTRARKEANNRGARVASLPGLTEEVMARTLSSGYGHIADLCRLYAAKITGAREVRITTAKGTDLIFSLEGRMGVADTGLLHAPGAFGNLPAGEAYIAPLEGTAQGILVVDGSMAGVGLIQEPIKIKVENGLATEITGGEEAKKLNALMEKHGQKARNIAELGIGLNDQAKITGVVLEDEKALGTIHIALGDNSTFGGTVEVDSHLDGIVLNPTVTVDGEVIIENGKLQLHK